MERKDLITKNAEGMREQALAMERFASKQIKVVVVANPANTNCLVAIKSAPSIPAENFTCLTRLDEERLRGFVAKRANAVLSAEGKGVTIRPQQVHDVVIWGNHSATQVPYIDCGRIAKADGTQLSASSLYASSPAELQDLIAAVQTRGAAIIKKQGASSGLSAANAIAAHLSDWLNPNVPRDKVFSMGILSDGNPYGIPGDLVYSFPLRRTATGVEIVPDMPVSADVRKMLDASTAELQGEIRDAATLEQVGGLFVSATPKPG